MNTQTNLFTLLFLLFLLASCLRQTVRIEVENPSDFDRPGDLVEIPLTQLHALLPLEEGEAYEVRNPRGEVIATQLTSDGKLLFQPALRAKETAVFTITRDTASAFEPQTYGRFVVERKDDFAWENDRVAFRIYGQALIPTDGPSNGLDIWYKHTSDLIIDKWYRNDLTGVASYHNDNGEGLDDYKVGRTLGAGAMAPYEGGQLWLNENFASSQILDNGPLRTTFTLTYPDLCVDGVCFSESRTFSIDAGSQLTKIVQAYGAVRPLTVAAGVTKREAGDSLIVDPSLSFVEYLEPDTPKAQGVYIGLVFPSPVDSVTVACSHVLAVTTCRPNRPVTYYAGYGWRKSGFADAQAFRTYLANFAEGLRNPLIVQIKQ